jgi:S1-C subfamily serine protease
LHGVVVVEVAPASTAEDLGFLRGDLIEEVNHNPVTSMTNYHKYLGTLHPGGQVVFKVVRHGDTDRLLTVYLAGVVPAP